MTVADPPKSGPRHAAVPDSGGPQRWGVSSISWTWLKALVATLMILLVAAVVALLLAQTVGAIHLPIFGGFGSAPTRVGGGI